MAVREEKVWVGFQAPGRLAAMFDREAGAQGLSRSAALREAMEQWLQREMEADEERITKAEQRHRQLMNRMDYLVGMIREQERQAEAGESGEGAESSALAEARKRGRRRTE